MNEPLKNYLLDHLMRLKDGEELTFRRDNLNRCLSIRKNLHRTKYVDRGLSYKELELSRDPEGLLVYNLEFMDEQLNRLDKP